MTVAAEDFAINIQGVRKEYGPTVALAGVSLQVRRGESRALLGRNGAGKSTLIGVLTGLVNPDQGTVEVHGTEGGPAEGAGSSTIACVYQKSTLVPDLTAAENISLGDYPKRSGGRVDWAAMRVRARKLLADWGFEHIADRTVADLEPVERKVVEICRALARGPKILLLDEPTAGLDEGGCQQLFRQIAVARSRGVSLIYVSHHLNEVFQVCDSVTVLRDGRDIATELIADLTVQKIVDLMVGQAAERAEAEEAADPEHAAALTASVDSSDAAVAISVTGLKVGDRINGVDLQIRRGECVGFTGLDGAGHVQLAEAMAGLVAPTSGTIEVNGKKIRGGSIRECIDAGIGFAPEDRHISGFVPGMSNEENSTMTVLERLRNKIGFINGARRVKQYHTLASAWSIKAAGPTQSTEELSGGNQQKVVLARALASDPTVLILIHPTAGVDVTAQESIYRTLKELAQAGCAVVICSADDVDLEICDRVIVMFKGEKHEEIPRGWDERTLVASVQGHLATSGSNT